MRRAGAAQRRPVAIDVTLNGRANLRAVAPPSFERPPDGSVQVIEKKLDVHRVRYDAWMSRQWQYLIFPSHDGEFAAPALTAEVLSTDGQRKQLRCDATTLIVRASAPNEPPPRLATRRPPWPSLRSRFGLWQLCSPAR